MDCGYIVNDGNGILRLYIKQGTAIRCVVLNKDMVTDRDTVAENSAGSFYVGEREGKHLILYTQADGTTVLKSDGKSRTIGRNTGEDINLKVLMSQRQMRLFYVKENSLQTVARGEKEASAPTYLGNIMGSYRLIPVFKGGYALLYKQKTPEVQLCYRETTVGQTGEAKELYTTGFDIGDSSLCSSGDAIHFAFVAMSRFAVRVMYVRKDSNGFTRPKNLWEGNRCSCVAIGCDGSDVFVWWESAGNVFESVSHNMGDSFSQSVRKSGIKIKGKALHLCEGCYGISEVMLMEKGIYAPQEVRELIYGRPARKNNEIDHRKSNDIAEETLKEELAKGREHIERLTDLLKSRGEEAVNREQKLRQRIRQLEEEKKKWTENKTE